MRALKKNSPDMLTISEIIERDASEVTKRNKPVFDESEGVRAKSWNHGIMWMQVKEFIDDWRVK